MYLTRPFRVSQIFDYSSFAHVSVLSYGNSKTEHNTMHEESELYWVDNHYHLMIKSQSKNSYVQDIWKSSDRLPGRTIRKNINLP